MRWPKCSKCVLLLKGSKGVNYQPPHFPLWPRVTLTKRAQQELIKLLHLSDFLFSGHDHCWGWKRYICGRKLHLLSKCSKLSRLVQGRQEKEDETCLPHSNPGRGRRRRRGDLPDSNPRSECDGGRQSRRSWRRGGWWTHHLYLTTRCKKKKKSVTSGWLQK